MTVEDVLEFLEEHREHNVLRSGITLGSICDYMGKCMDAEIEAQRTIAALTARLEQAELARDILCGTIRDMEEPKTVGSSTFTIERRGLPQDGGGK